MSFPAMLQWKTCSGSSLLSNAVCMPVSMCLLDRKWKPECYLKGARNLFLLLETIQLYCKISVSMTFGTFNFKYCFNIRDKPHTKSKVHWTQISDVINLLKRKDIHKTNWKRKRPFCFHCHKRFFDPSCKSVNTQTPVTWQTY